MIYPLGAHFQLVGAFLPAHVEYLALGHPQYCLQCERAFSYAGLTAQKHYRPWHQPAAEHTVEFGVVHVHARFVLCAYLAQS